MTEIGDDAFPNTILDHSDGGNSVPVARTRLSRRALIRLGVLGAGSAGIAGLLSACGSSSTSSSGTKSGNTASSATSAAASSSGSGTSNGSTPASGTSAAAGSPKKGGTLKYGLSTDIANFDPHVITGAADGTVKEMLYSRLITYDPDGKLIGDLAESYAFTDPKTLEFKLRKGVTFHNGDTLSADDVVYSMKRILDPATSASVAPRLASIDQVTSDGELGVKCTLKEANVTLPFAFAAQGAFIISKKWASGGGDLKTQVVGTGPFKLDNRQPGVAINLTRNSDYYISNLPYLDGIDFHIMQDDNARVTALRSGSVDFVDYVPYTAMKVLTTSPDIVFKSDSTLGFGWLGFVVDRKPVDDIRVRQAFAYGMDRSKMVEVAFSGFGSPINGSVIPKGWVGYSPDLQNTYDVDYAKSKQLLQQAGLSNFSPDILSTSSYSVISRPAIAAQAELKNADINGKLVMQEWLTFRKSVTNATYSIHVWGSALGYPDPDSLSVYLQSNAAIAKAMHFKDDKVDSWFAQGRQESDQAKRGEIYHEIEQRVLDLVPWTYLIRRVQGEAMLKFVQGYVHLPTAWDQITLRQTWLDK